MGLCFESRLYLYLLYWSVNSRKCSLWKTWGEGMFSWTYIHTGSDILSIHSTPRMYIYLCSMVSCRCCQSAWTDIVICLRNILQDYTPLSQATAAKYQTLRSFVLCLVLDTTAWSECVGVSTAWTDPGIPLRWDVRGHLKPAAARVWTVPWGHSWFKEEWHENGKHWVCQSSQTFHIQFQWHLYKYSK